MRHLIKPNQMNRMGIMYVPEGPHKKIGKVPDYLTKGFNKPSIVGSKVKGAIRLGRILYKSGAWKKVGRYYGFKYRYRIAGAGAGIGIALSTNPFLDPNQDGQTRSYMEFPRRRFNKQKRNTVHRCCICR